MKRIALILAALVVGLSTAHAQVDTFDISPSGKTVIVYPNGPGLAQSSIAYGGGFQNLQNQSGGTNPADLTGRYNVCVGFRCGTNMTTGMYNVGVGFEALEFCTTCKYNTAVGEASQIYTETSIGNTSSGWKALLSKVGVGPGNYNTCDGYAACIESSKQGGASNTANTAQGAFTLNDPNFTGSNNTVIGFKAGEDLTTGSLNTCLGAYSCKGITTGYGNVIIGNCPALAPGITNKVMICNAAGGIVFQSP